jgi:signal peptidase I
MTEGRNNEFEASAGTAAAGLIAGGEPAWLGTPRDGVKDTIESIVIAFILAFVFRAFVVEAFVIPTGSMAPTLYGAHGTITCGDCGTEFAYGLNDLDTARTGGTLLDRSATTICQNCNYKNRNLVINDLAGNAESGDRILVLKWPFDFGGAGFGAHRWDVIVFKDPADGTTNFIKRLVGLPEEVLMIVDGDVYTAPAASLSDKARAELETLIVEKHQRVSRQQRGPVPAAPEWVLEELDETLTIRRKTAVAQRALWTLHHDHDHPPRRGGRDVPRWVSGAEPSGWDANRRTVRFRDAGIEGDFIYLANKPLDAARAYNSGTDFSRDQPVSDVRMRFVIFAKADDGLVRLRMAKHEKAFWATLFMDGRVQLCESAFEPDQATPIIDEARLESFVSRGPVEVSFENVDYRVSVSIGGEEVLSTSTDPSSPGYYGPDIRRLRLARDQGPVDAPRIYAAGGSLDLSHLVIEKDVYYYEPDSIRLREPIPWPRSHHFERGWGTANNPIFLRAGEYFVLGDNSDFSKDSRLWDQVGPHLAKRGAAFQLGTVPEDQLIGRAFFVYWPAGHRIQWLEPVPKLGQVGIIPDVGRMRWIR